MRWQYPFTLYLLFIIPLLFFIYFSANKTRKNRVQLFGSELFQKEVKRSVHFGKRSLKIALLVASFMFLIVTLASPQVSSKVKVKEKLGSEFFLALDTSLSMLAKDENPNRLVKAKKEILHLLGRLEGYKVGLVVFAGTSFVQCPLTMDYSAIRYFLESIDTQSLPVPGTALKKVIENARKSFGEERDTRKYLVLFTDGEDLEGEDPVPEARDTSREGITIFCIGFGSPVGALIPLYDEKEIFTGYKKDVNGVTVITRLNEGLLTEIAHATRGRYFKSSTDATELDELLTEVAKHGRKKITEKTERQYESRFQLPLFLAVLFLMVELTISETRKNFES